MAKPSSSTRSWGSLGQLLRLTSRPAATPTTTSPRTLATTAVVASQPSSPVDKAERSEHGPVPSVDVPKVRQLRRQPPHQPRPSVSDAPRMGQLRRQPSERPRPLVADGTQEVSQLSSSALPSQKVASQLLAPVAPPAKAAANLRPAHQADAVRSTRARPPNGVTTMMPTMNGEYEVHYRMEDILRIAKGYRSLRSINNINSLTAKFIKQRRYETQQQLLASDKRHHGGKKGTESAVALDLSGLRGVPVLHKNLPDDWDQPKQSTGVGLTEDLLPRAEWRRGQRRCRVPTRDRIPLTVRYTTHSGGLRGRSGGSVSVPAPPMTADLHPGLPLEFLPTRPALLALEKPLFTLSAVPGGEPVETSRREDRDEENLRTQRARQASPAYVARVRALARESADPRVAALAEILLRRPADKINPSAAIKRKMRTDLVTLEGVNHIPAGEQVLSIGLFIPVGKKSVHTVACVRGRVQRKTRHALCEALKLDFAARGATPEAAQRWQGHIFHIVPNPMIKLLPIDRLVALMGGALDALHKRVHRAGPKARPSGQPGVQLVREAAERAVPVEVVQQERKLKMLASPGAQLGRQRGAAAVVQTADWNRRGQAAQANKGRQKAGKKTGPVQTLTDAALAERERLREMRVPRWEAAQTAPQQADPAAQGKSQGAADAQRPP